MDTIVAKARFGGWVEGHYTRWSSFPRNNAPRASGKRKSAAIVEDEGEEFWIHLKRLRSLFDRGTATEDF